MSIEKINLMFDGILEDCNVCIDKNGEYVCTTADLRFVKFPQGVNLSTAAAEHNRVNATIPLPGTTGTGIVTRIPPHIKNATALNIESDEKYILGTREDKACHFFDPFPAGKYNVQLRLDWGVIDNEGNPTLDADFIVLGTTQFDAVMKKHPAHHTKRQFDKSTMKYLYDFEYDEIKLRLIVQLSIGREITGVSNIVKPE
ncbi:MAG: hypothetical protein DMF63_12585 [Acidobacteria bacterium]|nr:MAG: hypothetical protein DMF63_12585 [Acidobacteriota bacterium]